MFARISYKTTPSNVKAIQDLYQSWLDRTEWKSLHAGISWEVSAPQDDQIVFTFDTEGGVTSRSPMMHSFLDCMGEAYTLLSDTPEPMPHEFADYGQFQVENQKWIRKFYEKGVVEEYRTSDGRLQWYESLSSYFKRLNPSLSWEEISELVRADSLPRMSMGDLLDQLRKEYLTDKYLAAVRKEIRNRISRDLYKMVQVALSGGLSSRKLQYKVAQSLGFAVEDWKDFESVVA